jgi:VIT1/CCC1 family predicted Fe2+/Mn2+ transporter
MPESSQLPATATTPRTIHPELHRTQRVGWLRAAVLGANDGIVSNASLLVGVAAAGGGAAASS